MPYQFYITEKNKDPRTDPVQASCLNDDAAVELALQYFDDEKIEAVEIRRDHRLVVRLQPEASAEMDY